MILHTNSIAEGLLYLAIIKDLCAKQIVGYAFSGRMLLISISLLSTWSCAAECQDLDLSSTTIFRKRLSDFGMIEGTRYDDKNYDDPISSEL